MISAPADPPPAKAPRGSSDESVAPLKSKAAAGVRWSAFSQLARQGMGVVTTATLARLLSPSDYGLMGMAMVVTGFINVFRDFGSSSALVQRRDVDDALLSTVFWANVAFGLLTACATAALSPLGALFFQEPRVTFLLCALAPTFVVNSLSIVQQALLQRELEFRALAIIEVVAAFFSYAVTVAIACLGGGVWSLVAQAYALPAGLVVLLWFRASWRPTWRFSWPALQSVRRYSLNMVGYMVFNYWARNAGNVLVGRFLGPTALGYYSMATRIVQYPTMATSGLVNRVLFPMLSRLQDDRERLGRAYFRTVTLIAVVALPLMLGIFALATPLVRGVLSNKWDPVVVPLVVLALVGANQSLATMTGSLYLSTGKAGLMFRVGIINGLLYILGIAVGLPWGILGVVLGYAAADLVATIIDYIFACGLLGKPFWAPFAAARRSLLCSAAMAAPIALASPWLTSQLGPVPALAVLASLGAVAYLGLSWAFNRRGLLDFWGAMGGRV